MGTSADTPLILFVPASVQYVARSGSGSGSVCVCVCPRLYNFNVIQFITTCDKQNTV